MPNLLSGLGGAIGNATKSILTSVEGAASDFQDPGPVIGPPLDDGYMEPPEGDVWKGLVYPEDLYGEDNGMSSNGGAWKSPFEDMLVY